MDSVSVSCGNEEQLELEGPTPNPKPAIDSSSGQTDQTSSDHGNDSSSPVKELSEMTVNSKSVAGKRSEGEDEINREKAPSSCPNSSTEILENKPYLFGDEMKFMTDFDPNRRLYQKKSKKFTPLGVVIDLCDCLIPKCPGCHFKPCGTCGSRKCAQVCRKDREWDFDIVEVQGKGIIRRRTDAENM